MKRPRQCSYQAKLMRLLVATDTASAARLFFTASLTTPNLTRIGRSGRGGIGGLLHDCYCALRCPDNFQTGQDHTSRLFYFPLYLKRRRMRHFGKGWLFTSANGDGGRIVCLGQVRISTRFQRCHAHSAEGYYRGNDALVTDAALTRKSLENSPVPIEAVPLESSVPDDAVPGLPPLV